MSCASMGAGKVKLAFIADRSKRKAAFDKRKKSLLKKMEELRTLCGIDACAIIHCKDFEPAPIYWPSRSEVRRVIGEFRDLPREEKTKNMDNAATYIEKRIKKVDAGLKKQMWDNRQKELAMTMFDCLRGRSSLWSFREQDMGHLVETLDIKLMEIEKRIKSLKGNCADQGAGPSSSDAAD